MQCRGIPFLLKDALYNQEWINWYCLISDGRDYVLLTHGGWNGRCWFGRFGGRYFTQEDLSIEFDVGEESSEVIGDVDGVVSYNGETDVSEIVMVVGFTVKVLQMSVGRWGVIIVWRKEWNFRNQFAVSPKMGN